jgi:hypothetical protein
MAYTVTHGPLIERGPIAIDSGNGSGFDLERALAHARRLLSEGKPNVAIHDGDGRSISGADLIACCEGKKTLTPHLRGKLIEVSPAFCAQPEAGSHRRSGPAVPCRARQQAGEPQQTAGSGAIIGRGIR